MATDNTEFLKDQVERLNIVLALYQKKYPLIESTLNQSQQDASMPWLTDQQLMAPLLEEYDRQIQEMKQQVEIYRTEHQRLKSQMEHILTENDRYLNQAKDNVTGQLSQLGVSVDEPLLEDEEKYNNLQERLANANADNEDYIAMLAACRQEVERLSAEIQYRQMTPSMEMYEKQAEEIKFRNRLALEEYEMERQKLIDEHEVMNKKCQASETQNNELKQLLEKMKSELINKDRECNEVLNVKETQEKHLDDKQYERHQLEHQLLEAQEDITQLRDNREQLEKQIIELNKNASNYEQSVYDAKMQVSNSVQMAENAILEKDQALIREKQCTEQVDNLQGVIDQMIDSVGERTREEVDEVKKRCNKNITYLMEEIHTLEMENSEKQAQIERAQREKRAAESELERIYKEGLVSGNKDSEAYDELNRRACDAERHRDEAVMKLNTMQHELNRAKLSYQQETSHQKSEVDQQKHRLGILKTELDDINSERLKLLEKNDSLHRQLSASKQSQESQQRQFSKDRLCFENELSIKHHEYEIKVQSLDDSHRSAMTDLRRLLTSQQKMSAKWKEECNTITQKFESKIFDLRSEVSQLKSRNDELARMLAESRNKTLQVEEMLTEYNQNIRRMEERVRDAENKSISTSAQVAKQLSHARRSLIKNRQDKENSALQMSA